MRGAASRPIGELVVVLVPFSAVGWAPDDDIQGNVLSSWPGPSLVHAGALIDSRASTVRETMRHQDVDGNVVIPQVTPVTPSIKPIVIDVSSR